MFLLLSGSAALDTTHMQKDQPMSSSRSTALPGKEVEMLHGEDRNEFIADLYSELGNEKDSKLQPCCGRL